jgi:hypothetical protein
MIDPLTLHWLPLNEMLTGPCLSVSEARLDFMVIFPFVFLKKQIKGHIRAGERRVKDARESVSKAEEEYVSTYTTLEVTTSYPSVIHRTS